MPALTKQEARQLADMFTEFSPAIGKYKYDHWEELDQKTRKLLMDLEYDLSEAASQFSALAGILTLEEVETSVSDLSDAIAEAEKFLKKVETVKTGLSIITGVFQLAAAVTAKDPKAILKELKGLKKLIA